MMSSTWFKADCWNADYRSGTLTLTVDAPRRVSATPDWCSGYPNLYILPTTHYLCTFLKPKNK